jgi:hypothetical protein
MSLWGFSLFFRIFNFIFNFYVILPHRIFLLASWQIKNGKSDWPLWEARAMTQPAWVPQQRGVHRISQKIHDAKWPCGVVIVSDWFTYLALVLLSTPLLSTFRSTSPRCFNNKFQYRHGPVVI